MKAIRHLVFMLAICGLVGMGCGGGTQNPSGTSPAVTLGGAGTGTGTSTPSPTVPPTTPPSQVACPGVLTEDFPLDQIRAYFYTGKTSLGWTDQAVYIRPLEGSNQGEMQILSQEYSTQVGNTTMGKTDESTLSLDGQNLTSLNFSTFQIRLGPPTIVDHWFLGGLFLEGLKKGCDPQKPEHWTPLYLNPFVRTWIDGPDPLLLSQEDVVAIFEVHVGSDPASGTLNPVFAGTPFEGGDYLRVKKTAPLHYSKSLNFEAGQKNYYGRTYFAQSQSQAAIDLYGRLQGKIGDLDLKLPSGFQVVLGGDQTDAAYFDSFRTYLVQPQFQLNSEKPFRGYEAIRDDVWLFTLLQYFSLNDSLQGLSNFGEEPSQTDAKGFFDWAIGYDAPGWI